MRSPRKDAHYARAKSAGYRARSAYKLIALDDRYRFLAGARRIVDVGAWPGSWLQVVLERVGPGSVVVGVDLEPVEPVGDPRAHMVRGDGVAPEVIDEVASILGGPADVLLSDASPKLTGVRATDEARLEALGIGIVEDAAPRLLRPGGILVLKSFTGPAGEAVRRAIASRFRSVRSTRPGATRRGSAEFYFVASDHYPHGCG
jgi:23S rRNA (uridine2552-2'-O)-methyltransferase